MSLIMNTMSIADLVISKPCRCSYLPFINVFHILHVTQSYILSASRICFMHLPMERVCKDLRNRRRSIFETITLGCSYVRGGDQLMDVSQLIVSVLMSSLRSPPASGFVWDDSEAAISFSTSRRCVWIYIVLAGMPNKSIAHSKIACRHSNAITAEQSQCAAECVRRICGKNGSENFGVGSRRTPK